MNRPLRRVAVACLLLFGLLLANVNYVQAVKASDYRNDRRNQRGLLRQFDHERGAIVLSGASPVALDRPTPTEQFKFLRRYPNGPLYAPVTGFSSFVVGQTGIEHAQNDVLSGESDQLLVRRLSDYVTGRQPEGGRVVLTIQQAAQRAAYDALQGKRGAAVALDPRTGAVLAMVSTPSYDPNKLSSHNAKSIQSYYKGLQSDDGDPLLNRVVQQTYPPGSTFKVITSAAALADGKTTPQTQIPSPQELDLPQTNRNLKNFGGESCGGATSTLAHALEISCNTAFGQLGLDLGGDKLREQAKKFGFGEDDLDVPQPVAKSVFPDELTPPQVAQAAIGQYDVRVTPLQMAMVAAGIANGGNVMKPYLVREVQGPDLSRLSATEPSVYKESAVTRDVADQLTAMMELVVTSGTGTAAQIPGVRVAGKTGTAQHGSEAPHAWFIGFAPADDPQVAVAVVVEDGGSAGSEATGGRVAAPIARAMMRAVLGQ